MRAFVALEGLYHIPESTSSVESLTEIDWLLGLGYKIELSNSFSLMPLLNYGGTIHFLNDTQEIDQSTFKALEGGIYYSQTVAFELDMELSPEKWVNKEGNRISLIFRPGYRTFFDSDYLGHSITAKTGVRINY